MSQVTANQCHNLLWRPLVPSGILLSSRVFTTRHRFSGLLDFRSRKSTWIPTQRIPLAAELQSAFSWFSTTVDAYLHHYEYHRGLAEFRLCIYWEGSATLCSRRRRRMPHPHRTAQCRKEGYEVWRKQPIKQPMTATTLVDWEAPAREMKSSLGPLPKEKFNLGDRKRMVQQRTTSSLFLVPQVQTANISSARTIAPPHLDVGRNPFPTFIHHRHLDRTPHVHSLLSLLSGQSPTRSCKTSLTMSHDKTGSDRAWRD